MADNLCFKKMAAKMMVNNGFVKIRAIASPTFRRQG